jgi:DNA-binding CsgD family transcriptional regulator
MTGTAGGDVLCPVVVGRDAELAALTDHLDAAVAGHGGLVLLVGEAGVGKSRLAREVAARAAGRGLPVLSGRAVPGAPLPFRPLSEALLVASRGSLPTGAPELAGFGPQLARLVPGAAGAVAATAPADGSPVLVGEAVIRLLRVLGRSQGAGCLLVLEDLHWADAETLAVVDYLAGTLGTERVLCLATTRAGPSADRTRGPAAEIRLSPLADADCARMVAACLAMDDVPDELGAFVVGHSDGVPFLVEELLAGLVSSGALVRRDRGWHAARPPEPSVPRSLAESVHRRLAGFDRTGRQVLGAAAVLGRRFGWELLPGVADVDGTAAVEALRRAVEVALVTVDGAEFRFRHALTREAVLAQLLPPERAALAARALTAVERAHPGLPGAWCELAEELAIAAGAAARAAALATESARRAVERGALTTAERAAARARAVAPDGSPEALDADEVLVATLAHAGKPGPAREIGLALLRRFDEFDVAAARRVELLLVLGRAALAAGDAVAADADLRTARAAATEDRADDAGTQARLDAVGAHVALARDRIDDARRLAEAAVDAAAAAGLPEVECEALEILGRLADSRPGRTQPLERAAALAQRHGLVTWRLRALQELALGWVNEFSTQRLREVRRVAAESGAFVTVAQMDLMLADVGLSTFDGDGCREAAERCVDASRRYGLASLPVAQLWMAGAHALDGREAEMEAALAEADAAAPGNPRVLADAWGRVRATFHVLHEDRAAVRHALDRSMEYTRRGPETESVYPGQLYWALLRAMSDDDLGAPARAEVAGSRVVRIGFGRAVIGLVDAVVLGRQGRREEAAATAARVDAEVADPGRRAWTIYALRLAAEAALRDGWGEPAAWLREAEAYFAARGHDRVARECRSLLKAAGAPVPRRGRGASDVPPALRGLGITSREVDVLALVAQGLPTKEIAARLVLSPRTVEHHVGSLLARTGLRDRAALVGFARANRVAPGP